MQLLDYLPYFVEALEQQLKSDQKRWGDEWKNRPIESDKNWSNQNIRIYSRFQEYYLDWSEKKTRIPWLKIAGLAMIAWVREQNPDTYSK